MNLRRRTFPKLHPKICSAGAHRNTSLKLVGGVCVVRARVCSERKSSSRLSDLCRSHDLFRWGRSTLDKSPRLSSLWRARLAAKQGLIYAHSRTSRLSRKNHVHDSCACMQQEGSIHSVIFHPINRAASVWLLAFDVKKSVLERARPPHQFVCVLYGFITIKWKSGFCEKTARRVINSLMYWLRNEEAACSRIQGKHEQQQLLNWQLRWMLSAECISLIGAEYKCMFKCFAARFN